MIMNESPPLLKLPTEVTCLLFDILIANRCLVGKPKLEDKPFLPELVVSHVCKRWREAALGYSRLWTSFFFRASTAHEIQNSINRFDMYIRRSGSQNLELFLDFSPKFPGRPQARVNEEYALMDMAVKLVERWRIVTLIAGLDVLHFKAHLGPSLLVAASAPNLEYFVYQPSSLGFTLKPTDHKAVISISSPTMFRGGAPKLQYLRLDCASQSIPPLSNITILLIEDALADFRYPWRVFLDVLSLPSLTSLSVFGEIFDIEEHGQKVTAIPMENLKHLRYNNCYMTAILPCVRAPLLETLWIQGDIELVEGTINPIPEAGSESYFFPSLQTLILVDATPFSPLSAYRMMKMTRNIKSLLVSCGDEDYNFFERLRGDGSFNDERWPQLTSLHLQLPRMSMVGYEHRR